MKYKIWLFYFILKKKKKFQIFNLYFKVYRLFILLISFKNEILKIALKESEKNDILLIGVILYLQCDTETITFT